MIRLQRKIHRLTWLLLTPLLLALIVVFSRPDTDLSPPNPALPTLPGQGTGAGKGVLP